MIFKSRQVNLDPAPYTEAPGFRHPAYASQGAPIMHGLVYAPRPEFEPTRDPLPWVREVWSPQDLAWVVNARLAVRLDFFPLSLGEKFRVVWAPRREQFDTPLNWVLAAFRRARHGGIALGEHASAWVQNLDIIAASCAVPDEIEHARKVLTRLAGAA